MQSSVAFLALLYKILAFSHILMLIFYNKVAKEKILLKEKNNISPLKIAASVGICEFK